LKYVCVDARRAVNKERHPRPIADPRGSENIWSDPTCKNPQMEDKAMTGRSIKVLSREYFSSDFFLSNFHESI
jgi:hypothetical protein